MASGIPPNWLSSILQAQLDRARATTVQQREKSSSRSVEPPQKSDVNAIENQDQDTAVFSDAEGRGGQGRSSDEPANPASDAPATDSKIGSNPAGSGLDVTA